MGVFFSYFLLKQWNSFTYRDQEQSLKVKYRDKIPILRLWQVDIKKFSIHHLHSKIETFKTENNTAPPTLNSSTEFININASNYIRIKL